MVSYVSFDGKQSNEYLIRRGRRQEAILSPHLANVFLKPLLEQLDNSNLGASILGCHVPAVCCADDTILILTNQLHLRQLLAIVENFASLWRLSFTHPNPKKTKSHCINFEDQLLVQTPKWILNGQQLRTVSSSNHLGKLMNSQYRGKPKEDNRIQRARGAFYGLSPVGMLSQKLGPHQKAFLRNAIILPTLTFGCDVAPIMVTDTDRLEACQAASIKSALEWQNIPLFWRRFASHRFHMQSTRRFYVLVTQVDADCCRIIFCVLGFSIIRHIAHMAKRLCTEQIDPDYLNGYLSCGLIALHKNPGVCPIGIGEVLRRIIGKMITWVLRGDIQEAAGSFQTCTGLYSGIEAAIHSAKEIFDNVETEAILLVDAKNAFNCINGKAALHNIQQICPPSYTYLMNIYQKSANLYIDSPDHEDDT